MQAGWNSTVTGAGPKITFVSADEFPYDSPVVSAVLLCAILLAIIVVECCVCVVIRPKAGSAKAGSARLKVGANEEAAP